MPKSALAFILAVVAAAATFASGHFPAPELGTLSPSSWAGITTFIATGVLLQLIKFLFPSGGQGASSIAFIPLFALGILFPPVVSLIAAVIVIGSSEVAARTGLIKGLFNVSQVALAIGIASQLYVSVYELFQRIGHTPTVNLVGFVVLVVVFFTINTVLTSIGIALYRAQPVGPTFRAVVGDRGGNVASGFLASPVVYLTVILYVDYHVFGILVTLLPVALLRRSYLSQKKLVEANQDLLTALIKAVETRDPYTSGHSLRVKTLAGIIAEDLSLPLKSRELVGNAALLHDIGKIDPVFTDVLRKPHSLTPEERELIQTHAAKGAEMLRDLSSVDRDVVDAVRHHHERFDGKGYPDGLAGENIPLTARIIMLSDSIDAMLSDRPYRRALTIEQVNAELVRCSGLQFDPEIVDIVLSARTLEKALELVAEWRTKQDEVRALVLA